MYKKDNRQKCKNYHGIAVTTSFRRFCKRILKYVFEFEIRIKKSKKQGCFRDIRLYMDFIFGLKHVVKNKMTVVHQINLLFFVLTKAYLNVLISKLWNVLNGNNIYLNTVRKIL